jgi:HD-like signal output (HDOD) protein
MKTDTIKNVIILRAAVSFLGEKKLWWDTKFHDSSSKDFLSYIFPKSKNTQFSCSNIATRNFIDNEVGANYYHLFRLPVSIEEHLHNHEKNTEVDKMESEAEAIQVLTHIANNLSINNNSGPKNIGSVDKIDNETIQVFAAEFLNAFKNDYKVYPYLI